MHDTRGFCGIALTSPTHNVNIDGAVRAAGCFDFDWIDLIGDGEETVSYEPSAPTCGHHKHLPIHEYVDGHTWNDSVPHNATVVRVDLTDDATPLNRYRHPERAVYWFGNESTGFSELPRSSDQSPTTTSSDEFDLIDDNHVTEWTDDVVTIPSDYCCNLAASVNVVAADRYAQTHGVNE